MSVTVRSMQGDYSGRESPPIVAEVRKDQQEFTLPYMRRLNADLEHLLLVERMRAKYERSRARLYYAQALRYAGLLDMVTGKGDSRTARKYQKWVDSIEKKLAQTGRAKKLLDEEEDNADHACNTAT